MSFVCDRCGHRTWGPSLGGSIGRAVCHNCFYGGWSDAPAPSDVWARLAAVARSTESEMSERWLLLDHTQGHADESAEVSWTFRLPASEPGAPVGSLPRPRAAH